jgi:hypothetical protein
MNKWICSFVCLSVRPVVCPYRQNYNKWCLSVVIPSACPLNFVRPPELW